MIETFTPEVAAQICGLLGLKAEDTASLVIEPEGVFVTTHRRNASGCKFTEPFTGEVAKDYAYVPAGSEERS